MTQNDDLKLLLSRAEDAIFISDNKYIVKAVGFLTPFEAAFLKKNIKPPQSGQIIYFGGYDEAERTLFIVLPEYYDEAAAKNEIAVLNITGRNLSDMTHRDFLGSLMGLGIKRETIGDILVLPDKCLVFVRRDIADYIASNLEKIGHDGIKLSVYESDEIEIPERKCEEISGTVAAIRLDSVLSVALKTSRAKAADYIASGLVSINWEETENVSKNLSEGDIISVKKKGRFKVSRIGGLTKKGRYGVVIEKYV